MPALRDWLRPAVSPRQGILEASHKLVAHETMTLDSAYVHLTPAALREVSRLRADLASKDVYSVGRYGAWRYCSIEDNILEAWALVDSFGRSR